MEDYRNEIEETTVTTVEAESEIEEEDGGVSIVKFVAGVAAVAVGAAIAIKATAKKREERKIAKYTKFLEDRGKVINDWNNVTDPKPEVEVIEEEETEEEE